MSIKLTKYINKYLGLYTLRKQRGSNFKGKNRFPQWQVPTV